MAGGQAITSGQGSVTPSRTLAGSGQASASATGTMVADSGNGVAISGSGATASIGSSPASTFIGLQSRKVGGGTVAYLLGGSGMSAAQGAATAGPRSATVGSLLSGSQGSMTKSRTMGLSGSAATAFPGTITAQNGASAISADFSMTRTSGFMPVQVTVDAGLATTTTVSQFNAAGGVDMQLYYVWDFGDNQGAIWAISGQPKNSESGAPVQAHTYDDADGTTAGVKTITLTAYGGHPWQAGGQSRMQTIVYDVGAAVWADPSGGSAYNTYICATQHSPSVAFSTDLGAGKWTLLQSGRISSTVQKTFTCNAYSAANTIVVNPTGTNDGTVVGATYQSTMPNAAAASGKLTLVKRGMSGLTIPQFTGAQYGAFKAYGSGAKPSIGAITTAGTGQATGTNSSYSDFQIQSNSVFAFGKSLLLRVDVTSSLSITIIADASASGNGEPTADFSTWSDLAFVDCNLNNNQGGASTVNWYGAAEYLTFMGCDFQGAGNHELRTGGTWRSVLAHNRFRGNNPNCQDILKLHAGTVLNVYNGPGSTVVDTSNPLTKTTSRLTVAYNEGFSATSTSYMFIHPAPQNDGQAEGVFKVWVEYNWMAAAPGTGAAYAGGRDIAIRRNQNRAGSAFTYGTGHSGSSGWTSPSYFR